MMLVSVIIPTYNRATTLPLAIESVLRQSYPHWEIVVIDDGSTDNTGAILESYLNRQPDRIQYHTKTNGGCASARNLGLRLTRGEAVVFLDSDDWLLPKKLEHQVACLEKTKADLAYGPWFDYYAQEQQYVGPFYPVAFDQPGNFARLHFLNTNFSFTAAVVRRRCFELSTTPFDETFLWNEDSHLAQRMALAGAVWAAVDYPSFVRRVHAGSKSRNRARIYESLLRSAELTAEEHPEFRQALGSVYDRRIAELKLLLARSYYQQGITKATDLLGETYRLYPDSAAGIRRRALDVRLAAALWTETPPTPWSLARRFLRRLLPARFRAHLRRLAAGHARPRAGILPEHVPGAPAA